MNTLGTPSLSNLSHYAQSRARGLTSPVLRDRRQAEAPSDGRFASFYYEGFLTGAINFVTDGNRGGALAAATEKAHDSRRTSYTACGAGLVRVLQALQPASAKRGPKQTVADEEGKPLVRVRSHLDLTSGEGVVTRCFLHFSPNALTPAEHVIVETCMALAAAQSGHDGPIGILLVRSGKLELVDTFSVLSPARLEQLSTDVDSYRMEWDAAA